MAEPRKPIDLDWSKLLGFDQAGHPSETRAGVARAARVGSKVGSKPDEKNAGQLAKLGAKVGDKRSRAVQTKVGVRIGSKVGDKNGRHSVVDGLVIEE